MPIANPISIFQLEKAKLYKVDSKKLAVDLDSGLTVQFNPPDLSISRSIESTKTQLFYSASAYPIPAISVSNSVLKLQLCFDSELAESEYHKGIPVKGLSGNSSDWLMEKTKNLEEYTRYSSSWQPSLIQFIWGTISFIGLCTSCSIRYTKFNTKGNPLRAIVDMTLEGDDAKRIKALKSKGFQF